MGYVIVIPCPQCTSSSWDLLGHLTCPLRLHRKAIKEIEEKIRLFFEPEAEMPRRCPRTADRAVPKLRSPWNPKVPQLRSEVSFAI